MYTKGQSSLSLLPPSTLNSAFTALVTDAHLPILLAKLEAARRTNGRVLLAFGGVPRAVRDANGFSLTLWKQRIEPFRKVDLSSYIADGTLLGHFLMDEPNDRTNWNGTQVSVSDIEEMARYSKEIWPDLPAIIRARPDYLKGYHYKYLDAAWAQYNLRFGPIDAFIANNVREAKASGLALVSGLNVLSGGDAAEMKGFHRDKFAMTASQVRAWGNAILAEPYVCAFFMFRYNPDYLSRPDIQAAMDELREKAEGHQKRACRRS